MDGQEDRKFFIIGCQRTGTTMMRLILDSHPDIHCFDEWKGYSALLDGKYPNAKNAKLLGFKCPGWTKLFLTSEKHQKIIDSSPIIFMLRDVRGCIASMLNLKTGEGTFFNGVQRTVREWENEPHRPVKEILSIKNQTYPKLRAAALYWREQTLQYIELIKLNFSVLPIHYEQFVQFPESHLRIICNFLQVPWDDALLRHHEFSHDETPNGKAVGDTALDRPVDLSSTMLWMNIFTSQEEAAILETAGSLNDYVSILRSGLISGDCTAKKITLL